VKILEEGVEEDNQNAVEKEKDTDIECDPVAEADNITRKTGPVVDPKRRVLHSVTYKFALF
jgi:hypothetical protein